jgi:hydroxymethylpyrimidine pyrophosphatase-like HAD family hydrolase
MLRWANTSIAMENSIQIVKDEAKFVAGNVLKDGIVDCLLQIASDKI